jgi:DNA-binding XRE family transcriptional regulator
MAKKKLKVHGYGPLSACRKETGYKNEINPWLQYSQQSALSMLNKIEELNLAQQTLAENLSFSRRYVNKLLKGQENPSLETLAKIENVLRVNMLINDQQI